MTKEEYVCERCGHSEFKVNKIIYENVPFGEDYEHICLKCGESDW